MGTERDLPDIRSERLVVGKRYRHQGQEYIATNTATGNGDSCEGCDLIQEPDCGGILCNNRILVSPINYITRKLLK